MPAPSDVLQFMRGQLFQTPTYDKDTNLNGKTIVITGANTGLGFECAKQLAGLNVSTLVLGCRDVSKGDQAKKSILTVQRTTALTVQVWQIDMASYASVMAFAKRMRTDLSRVDGLLANAGISRNQFMLAEDCESTLTVNVVSTFLLSLLALPQLEDTASTHATPTHLTITGSVVHTFADHSQLVSASKEKVFSSMSDPIKANMDARYFISKLIVMECVQEMAKGMPMGGKLSGPSVILNCPNPGWCKTGLFREDDGGAFPRSFFG